MPAKPGFSQTKVCGYQGRFRVILQEPPVKVVSHEGAKSFVLAKNLSGPNLRGFGWMLIADT
ncbi:hypothetical protein HYY75_01280 [bacterium]|nr:hypothetical protein [bacterium]